MAAPASFSILVPGLLLFAITGGAVIGAAVGRSSAGRLAGVGVGGALAFVLFLVPVLAVGFWGMHARVSAPPPPRAVEYHSEPWQAGLMADHGHDHGDLHTSAEIIPQEAIEAPLPDAPSHDHDHATEAETLPDWAQQSPVEQGDGRTLVVVSSGQFAAESDAREDALRKAAAALRDDFARSNRDAGGGWSVDAETARRAVRKTAVVDITREAGRSRFTVRRAYMQIELSPETRSVVESVWRRHAQSQRSLLVGGAVGAVTSLFALVAGYFFVDDRTQGRYRGRLKVGLAGFVIFWATVVAMIG